MLLEPVARAICEANSLTFVRYVGAGAFKQTFEVQVDGVSHALKVYNANNNPERAAREVDAMTRCTHQSIGRLIEISAYEVPAGRYAFSVEEYLGGGTLSARLSGGPMSPSEVFRIGVSLVDAVAHIAGLDLVHRDLKPDNIMFRADGVSPVVVDFGLVRDLGARSLTQTHVMQRPGTPLFAPAEQLLNDKTNINWRADQFSLGVVLSYCAFGVHPYEALGDTSFDIIARVAERSDPGSSFVDAAHAAGLPVLVKMVQPWPVQRYRTPDLLSSAWGTQQPTDERESTILLTSTEA